MIQKLPAESAPGEGLRAVMLSLAHQAERDVAKVAEHPEQRIHSLRTAMKKFRSMLRLAHDGVSENQRRALRERVRILKDGMAGSRDDVVIFKTVQRLLGEEAPARLGLVLPHGESETMAPTALVAAAGELVVLAEMLDLDDLGARDLKERWKLSRRNSRKAMSLAGDSDDAHDFHVWRKHVKDVWYQSTALGGLKKRIESFRRPAQKLSEVLGREHDLTIVLTTVKKLSETDRVTLENARRRLRKSALALAAKMEA